MKTMKTMSNDFESLNDAVCDSLDNWLIVQRRLSRARIAFNKAKASLEKAELAYKVVDYHNNLAVNRFFDVALAERDRLDVAC